MLAGDHGVFASIDTFVASFVLAPFEPPSLSTGRYLSSYLHLPSSFA